MSEDEDFDGVDSAGRKKPVKRPPVKFELLPREDGEKIEDWIKREAQRLVDRAGDCKHKRELIKRIEDDRVAAGYAYSKVLNEHTSLQAKSRRAIKKFNAEQKKMLNDHKKSQITPARQEMRRLERLKKAQLAKYNTLYNRYFNAVKVRVFQNMKSLCDIKHTWANKNVKRSIQNSDAKSNWKPNARKEIERMEEKANAS